MASVLDFHRFFNNNSKGTIAVSIYLNRGANTRHPRVEQSENLGSRFENLAHPRLELVIGQYENKTPVIGQYEKTTPFDKNLEKKQPSLRKKKKKQPY